MPCCHCGDIVLADRTIPYRKLQKKDDREAWAVIPTGAFLLIWPLIAAQGLVMKGVER